MDRSSIIWADRTIDRSIDRCGARGKGLCVMLSPDQRFTLIYRYKFACMHNRGVTNRAIDASTTSLCYRQAGALYHRPAGQTRGGFFVIIMRACTSTATAYTRDATTLFKFDKFIGHRASTFAIGRSLAILLLFFLSVKLDRGIVIHCYD